MYVSVDLILFVKINSWTENSKSMGSNSNKICIYKQTVTLITYYDLDIDILKINLQIINK